MTSERSADAESEEVYSVVIAIPSGNWALADVYFVDDEFCHIRSISTGESYGFNVVACVPNQFFPSWSHLSVFHSLPSSVGLVEPVERED